MKTYQSLLAFRPTRSDALFGLAMLYEGQGENKAAHDMLGRLTKVNPKHADAWYQVGRLAERGNDLLEAAYAYKQATPAQARVRWALMLVMGGAIEGVVQGIQQGRILRVARLRPVQRDARDVVLERKDDVLVAHGRGSRPWFPCR